MQDDVHLTFLEKCLASCVVVFAIWLVVWVMAGAMTVIDAGVRAYFN